MKVCVYAICKNESQFIDRWMDSMSEADYIAVLDTGSTDDTVEKLLSRGAIVGQKIISPWRFDVARNESLKLIPEDTDICVCTDLDEVWSKGWRAALEEVWTPGTEQATYRYVWSYNNDGTEGHTFIKEKIHAPRVFKWVNPVHEILKKVDGKEWRTVHINATLSHYPDNTKSRGSYLPLLELAVEEDPTNDRNTHYLGREYMYYGQYEKAIDMLKRHLALPSALWADERCASMRFIGRCESALNRKQEAHRWFMRACAEAPYLREPWVEAAECAYQLNDWASVIYFAEKALTIENRVESYICEPSAWGELAWDLLSIAYWNVGRKKEAYEAALMARTINPNDERIKNNLIIMKDL
jgi:glycosyltransferase involved in cell wall biosynthesis